MAATATSVVPKEIVYPESDGLPMADNTKQARWIIVLYDNLSALFRGCGDVFIAANVNWFPVEAEPEIRAAPGVFLVFGRPKGDRTSYKQWEENDVPVTVAFEILSPGNKVGEMIQKEWFYEDHGVEEYYVYDPDADSLYVYVRQGDMLRRQRSHGFVSPRMGVRFDLSGEELVILRSDGKPFLTFEQLQEVTELAQARGSRLAELSRKARRGQASAEELAELDRLEDELSPPSA